MDYNFKDHDKLVLCVKKNNINEIINYYEKFGYKIIDIKNKKISNIVELFFIRDHNIKNKDQLHILQADLENLINKKAQNKSKKYLKSASKLIFLFFLTFAFIFGGVTLLLNMKKNIFIICSILFFIVAIFNIFLTCFIAPNLIKKDKDAYNLKNNIFDIKIKKIINFVEKIMENKNVNWKIKKYEWASKSQSFYGKGKNRI